MRENNSVATFEPSATQRLGALRLQVALFPKSLSFHVIAYSSSAAEGNVEVLQSYEAHSTCAWPLVTLPLMHHPSCMRTLVFTQADLYKHFNVKVYMHALQLLTLVCRRSM